MIDAIITWVQWHPAEAALAVVFTIAIVFAFVVFWDVTHPPENK